MPLIFLVFDYCDAANKLKEQSDQLIGLNYDNMGMKLFSYGVITFSEKEIIDTKVNHKKMEYLIVDIIIRSLNQGLGKKYKCFLKAMEHSDDTDLQSTAKSLGKLIFNFTKITKYTRNNFKKLQFYK